MRLIFIATIIALFSSCDPMDDRLTVQNNTDENLFVNFCFIENGRVHETWAGVRPIIKNKENVIAILGSWESEFNQARPMDLYVIIHDQYKLLADTDERSIKAKSDSLIRVGGYVYKTYSYQELISRDWKIIYPNDVFDIGTPIEGD